MLNRLRSDLKDLMLLPGLSGHEDRVRQELRRRLPEQIDAKTDRLGNLIASFPGDPDRPSVMLFAHMDQLGFVVRKIEDDGLVRLERLGGVPVRTLLAQPVLFAVGEGRDVAGVIASKSHHATQPVEKMQVPDLSEVFVDAGFSSREDTEAAGIRIGTPVTYLPTVMDLGLDRIAGTAVDDRAGCAVLLEVARSLTQSTDRPTVHLVFSVQEEFNLRGAVVAAQTLQPDIAIQLDLMIATDTPDLADRGDMRLGGGPGISLYSFHGRGTLNGVIPHPALVTLFETASADMSIPLQRSAQTGILTDLSYVQTVGGGVASLDVGFPMRYSHSSMEVVDLSDLDALTRLLIGALDRIGPGFSLDRDGAME